MIIHLIRRSFIIYNIGVGGGVGVHLLFTFVKFFSVSSLFLWTRPFFICIVCERPNHFITVHAYFFIGIYYLQLIFFCILEGFDWIFDEIRLFLFSSFLFISILYKCIWNFFSSSVCVRYSLSFSFCFFFA